MYGLSKVKTIILAFVLAFGMITGIDAFNVNNVSVFVCAAKKARISDRKISLNVGEKKNVNIKNRKKNCKYIYKSSKKKIVSVSKKGVLSAKKTGFAKITVIEKNKKNSLSRKVGILKVSVKNVSTESLAGEKIISIQTDTPVQSDTDTNVDLKTENPAKNDDTADDAAEVTVKPSPDPYTTELFSISVSDTKNESVDGNTCIIDMQFFNGNAEGDYFKGKFVKDGCDVIKTFKESGEIVHNARYFLDGTDDAGNKCRIFIEDKSIETKEDAVITKPIFITNSMSLAWLEKADIQGRVTKDENGVRTVKFMWNKDNKEPVPFREVHIPDSSNNYSKELFSFHIDIGATDSVKGTNGSASTIYFGGSSDCANFKGNIILADGDTRLQYNGTIQTLSARYILSGKAGDGVTPMKIYVENNGIDDNGMVTEPTVITDNPAFKYIESAPLHGTVSWETGLTIHIWSMP